MRKKRNARAGQAFRQAKCLDEGVDISAVEGDAGMKPLMRTHPLQKSKPWHVRMLIQKNS